MTLYNESWRDETVSLELDNVTEETLYEFDEPETFEYNEETYEYLRRYKTTEDPENIDNVILDKIYGLQADFDEVYVNQDLYVYNDFYLSRYLFDKDEFQGTPGQVLISDENGVRWGFVSSDTPALQSIDVYDEGVYQATVSRLDFYDGNDQNNLVRVTVASTLSDTANIIVSDRWSKTDDDIYRVSRVGINTIPQYDLDVFGTTKLSDILIVGGNTTLNSTLDVDGATTLNSSLDVDGATTLNNTLDVDGATTINNTLDVDDATTLNSSLDVDGATTLNSSLDVDGATTLNSSLDVDGATTLNSSLDVDGATTLNSSLDVDGATTLNNTLDVDGATTLNSSLDVDGATTLNNTLDVDGTTVLNNTLELNSSLIDINNSTATGKFDYRLASVGTGVSWRPPGVQTKRAIWVTMDGNDANSGLLEGDAKKTVGAAASIAESGDTIFVRSGVYLEDNPIGLRTDVSVSGQDLRLVTIVPKNSDKDVFHVRRGCLIENLNFAGQTTTTNHSGCSAVAFPSTIPSEYAITGYIAPGPATEGPSGRWRSPYVRNCTNFMSGSIGMKINGDHATAFSIGADLKSMVCDSFTQYNENGIGVSITNNGYAQLVSIFTINCNIGIYCDTGGSCDLTNSNSSFGNFGLVSIGLGRTEFTGKVLVDTLPDIDTIGLTSVFDTTNNPRRPYDGQALWFKINLDRYPDTPNGIGIITAPLQELSSIVVLDGGSGFSQTSPPNVIIRDFDGTLQPKGPQGIIAEASANIDSNGRITSIDVISTGRNYLPSQNIVVDVEGNTDLATAIMSPIYYTVSESTQVTSPIGITTVTFNEFVPYELFEGDEIELRRISRILTSSHSFEYIGTGTDINTSTPFQGAVPIKANEVVALDGAQIPFTSTDQKGNFDIGEGIQVDQTTSTIRGRSFSRALQAEVTPLILALR